MTGQLKLMIKHGPKWVQPSDPKSSMLDLWINTPAYAYTCM